MSIRFLSFDFDGCLFNRNYLHSSEKDIIRYNQNFLETIRSGNNLYSQNYAFVGSNRQDYATDLHNARLNTDARGSCFPAFTQVCHALTVIPNTFLLADLYHDLPHGHVFKQI